MAEEVNELAWECSSIMLRSVFANHGTDYERRKRINAVNSKLLSDRSYMHVCMNIGQFNLFNRRQKKEGKRFGQSVSFQIKCFTYCILYNHVL